MTATPQSSDAAKLATALRFFTIMAFIVGVGLLILVLEMVFEYLLHWNGDPGNRANPLAWWPQPHGFLYMIYLAATANLGFKAGWSLPKMVGVMLAGCVPFLSFVVERKVAAEFARPQVASAP